VARGEIERGLKFFFFEGEVIFNDSSGVAKPRMDLGIR
jgi:hypothetical protein